MAKEFIVPKQILTGAGALELAADRFTHMGTKALIVTDPMMLTLGNIEKLERVLHAQKIESVVFDGITGEPTDQMIEAGLALYKNEACDFLIALGGGSPIDAMKAIASLVNTDCAITDYMGRVIDTPVPPMAAIPTTAGTGSEATQFTIITDTTNNIKMLLKGAVLMPSLAVIDPQFTMTAPAKITAATGLDALCHAVEAYTSRKAQLLSDVFALSAVKRIFKWLPKAYQDGSNEEARIEMSVAALEAGMAFNNSSVTLIHGMSRPIGALYHIAHGLSNAMIMNECLSFASSGTYERFAVLGRAVGAATAEDDDIIASNKFLAALAQLCKRLDIPTLEEYGVSMTEFASQIDKMAHDAMESGSPQNTRRVPTEADIKKLYQSLK